MHWSDRAEILIHHALHTPASLFDISLHSPNQTNIIISSEENFDI